jgi:hypothetical protein
MSVYPPEFPEGSALYGEPAGKSTWACDGGVPREGSRGVPECLFGPVAFTRQLCAL